MITDSKERAQFWQSRRARFAEPDTTPVFIAGREFTRTLGKRCPQCGQMFFTYQETGHERQPYLIDPEPDFGRSIVVVGARETCGFPGCLEDEQKHQMKRRMFFAGAKVQGAAS